MLQESGLIDDFKVRVAERKRAVLAVFSMLLCQSAVAGLVASWASPLILLAAVACNRHQARFLNQRKGTLFTRSAMVFHQLYYLCSTGAYAWDWRRHHISKLLRS